MSGAAAVANNRVGQHNKQISQHEIDQDEPPPDAVMFEWTRCREPTATGNSATIDRYQPMDTLMPISMYGCRSERFE